MRRTLEIAWMAAAAASGCGGGDDDAIPWPALQIDVVVSGGIMVSALEVARPDACTLQPFLRTGCGETSDAVSCIGPRPAQWIDEVTLVSGDQVLKTAVELPFYGVWFGANVIVGHGDLAIVLVASDDQRVVIPIPDTAPPLPVIDELTYDGVTLHVGWTATPAAASAVVEVSDGFVGRRCHVPAPQDVDLVWPLGNEGTFTVTSFAAPATTDTAFGEAKVWIGGRNGSSVPIE